MQGLVGDASRPTAGPARAAADRLVFTLPAQPGAPGLARNRLRRWLATAGCPDEFAEDLVYAANEAISNACEHAYRGRPVGPVEVAAVRVRPADGMQRIRITVRDQGRWTPPVPGLGHRGRGLTIMSRLVDDLAVRHAVDGSVPGTEVVLLSRALAGATGGTGGG